MQVTQVNEFNISMIDIWIFVTNIKSIGNLFGFVEKANIENGMNKWILNKKGKQIFNADCLLIHIVNKKEDVKRIMLTASGGPFLNHSFEDLARVTPAEALKHPRWKMGKKITVDSATLMNKGLEVIEAAWLFDMPAGMIDVYIHPQSIVHSLVEYIDGSIIAQLSLPDMRGPIAYALSYPERIDSGLDSLNLFTVS